MQVKIQFTGKDYANIKVGTVFFQISFMFMSPVPDGFGFILAQGNTWQIIITEERIADFILDFFAGKTACKGLKRS